MHFGVKTSLCSVFLLPFLVCVSCEYSDCGSETGKLVSVAVPGCDMAKPRCLFPRGTNQTIQIGFKMNESTDKLTAVVHGIILGVAVRFDLPNPDACTESGLTCPLKSGSSYNYEATLPILDIYPKVTVDVKWELQDASSKDVICGVIPIKID